MAFLAVSIAKLISASLKMINGDLPPNSRETGLRLLLAAASITSLPTSVDPVKLICNQIIPKKEQPELDMNKKICFYDS